MEARCLLSGVVPLIGGGRGPDLFGGIFITTLANKTVPASGQVPTFFEIENGQASAAGAFTVAFYLSDDPTISTADTLITTRSEAGVSGNSSRDDSITLQLPASDPFLTDNNYYIGMIVDSTDAVSEINELNNANRGTGSDRDFVKSETDLPGPLDNTNVNATAMAINSTVADSMGGPINASDDVGNSEWIGSRDIDTFSFTASAGQRLVFDTDNAVIAQSNPGPNTYLRVLNSSFALVASNDDGLAPHEVSAPYTSGESYLDHTFTIAGTYYVVISSVQNAAANPRQFTGRSTVNAALGRYNLTISDTRADLRTDIQLGDAFRFFNHSDVVNASGGIVAGCLIDNDGYVDSGAFSLDFYLSDDPTITTADVFVSRVSGLDAPAEGSVVTDYIGLTLPRPSAAWTDNVYYLGALVDSTHLVSESHEDNNTSSGEYVGPAELNLPTPVNGTAFSLTGNLGLNTPVSGSIGDEWIGDRDQDLFSVTTRANQTVGFDLDAASGSALDSYLRVYDSAWNLLASNDNAIAPLESGTTVDSYLAYSFSSAGTYYIVVSGAGNSSNDPRLLSNRSAATTGGYTLTAIAPDLLETSMSTTPSTPLPASAQTTVQVTFANQGQLNSPATTGRIYVTQGNQTLATVNVPALPAGGTYSTTVPVTLPTPPLLNNNNRYIIAAFVDPSDTVQESSDSNNGNRGAGLDQANVSYESSLPVGFANGNTTLLPVTTSIGSNTAGDIGGDEWAGVYDIDIFSVTATANEKFAVDLDRTSGALDSYIRVYNPSFNLVASNDNGTAAGETPSTDSYVECTATAAGTYTIVVSSTANSAADPHVTTGRQAGTTGAYTIDLKQLSPPHIDLAAFNYLTGPQSIVLSVNENVSSTLIGSNTITQNLTTAASVPSSIAFDGNTNIATATFPGQPDNSLPDGNYRMTVLAANVIDSAGNHLDGNGDGTGGDDYSFDFFFLNADANRDRVVNALDFNALASNYGGTGRNFAQGNFNYDGVVNSTDFDMLASRFGKSLPPLPGASVVSTPMASLFSQRAVDDDSSLPDILNDAA